MPSRQQLPMRACPGRSCLHRLLRSREFELIVLQRMRAGLDRDEVMYQEKLQTLRPQKEP
jgi:hypothetical protein